MDLAVELERETDGRWIAAIPALSGVAAYGETRKRAIASAKALALRVLADLIEHAEEGSEIDFVRFVIS